MSIKRTKGYYKVLFRPWNSLDLQKENFVSFSTSTNMDRESLKWGFRAQRCSFVRVSYISQDFFVIREKHFRSAPLRIEWMRKITNFEPLTKKKKDRINSSEVE